MTPTIRQQALDTMLANFTKQFDELGNPYFDSVQRGGLSAQAATKRRSVGIVAGRERKSIEFPLRDCVLDVLVEFRVTYNRGDPEPAELAEQVLAAVQQVLYDDNTLGGLVISVDETTNEVDLDTYADRTIMGVVHASVHYRHSYVSVYDPSPSF